MARQTDGLPTLSQWEAMFQVLTEELLSLEKVSLDPDVEPEVREAAVAQMDEIGPVLWNMKQSRGFIPGGPIKL